MPTPDDMIRAAGALLQKQLFSPRDPSQPRLDFAQQNDLNPNTAQLAFQVSLLNDTVNALVQRVTHLEDIIRRAARK